MITATLVNSSTRWGTGKTRCFLCGLAVEYTPSTNDETGTLPYVTASGLCNKGCDTEPGAHQGDCYALGGDLCDGCEDLVKNDPGTVRARLQMQIASLLDKAGKLNAWMTVDRWDSKTPKPITVCLASVGHDGRCDSENGCQNAATHVVLAASKPECVCGMCPWDSAPAASLGFLCIGHTATEPIAQREHAEHNAALSRGPLREVWDILLAAYPSPVPLSR